VSDSVPFAEDPEGTYDAIMYATFSALKKYGYAELSIQRIASELNFSKSTLYHHFSDKDDLLLSFFNFLLDELEQFCKSSSTNEPKKELLDFVDVLLDEGITQKEQSAKGEILAAYIELRSQAIHDTKYRERITRTDKRFVKQIAVIIDAGIDKGVFQPVEPEETAEFILAILNGILMQGSTRKRAPFQQLRQNLIEYIQTELFVESATRS